MKIYPKEVTVRDVVRFYMDDGELGVSAYGGNLDIRPPYQREYVYKDSQRDAVIDTIKKDLPLNIMYWVKVDEDKYEVLDGQQRTISFCEYVHGNYSINSEFFFNLPDEEQEAILDYKLLVYVCEGSDVEKLEWFTTINIAGERLTSQELKNAVYTGPWVTDAKGYFSSRSSIATKLGGDYLNGVANRQEHLETVIKWAADREGLSAIEYMRINQYEDEAIELWEYFEEVIAWVKGLFPIYRSEMKSVEWGILYNIYGDNTYSPLELEEKVQELMADEEITSKRGIYPYLFNEDEKHLRLKTFTPDQRRTMYERQKGLCHRCGKLFEFDDMVGKHIVRWRDGGKTEIDNGNLYCKDC